VTEILYQVLIDSTELGNVPRSITNNFVSLLAQNRTQI